MVLTSSSIKIVLLAAVFQTAAAGTLRLPAVVRDFKPQTDDPVLGHPDFQIPESRGACGEDRGVVETQLGPDRKPRYAPCPTCQSPCRTVSDEISFDQFYNTGPKSREIAYELVLEQSSDDPPIYSFASGEFFPIDGQGFGNWPSSPDHNYHFTLELHSSFTYRGGEVFNFEGDDDVWVFINNQLVIDLGGIHPPEFGSVELDSLGLTVGQTYNFDFFFNERFCCGSNLILDTSIALDAPAECGDGVVQPGEECDAPGPNSCCDMSTCRFKSAGATCRAAVAGGCDAPEVCDGASAACPPDAKFDGDHVCRRKAGPCDCAETCDGVSDACPEDLKHGPSLTCRASAGDCDPAEVCDGVGNACPADVRDGSDRTCRASAGPCDAAEVCNGVDAQCPADAKLAAGHVCRASAGACDAAEKCDGSTNACPADGKLGTSHVCRASTGPCDPQEVCPGNSNSCPTNRFASQNTPCRPSAGACDRTEYCSGWSASCPTDKLESRGTLCHVPSSSNNWCDRRARCSGSSAVCPVSTADNCGVTLKCLCKRRSWGRGYDFVCLPDDQYRHRIANYPRDVQWLPSTGRRPTSQSDCNSCPNDYRGGHDGNDDDDRDGYSRLEEDTASKDDSTPLDAAAAPGAAPEAALVSGVVAAAVVAALAAAVVGVRVVRHRQRLLMKVHPSASPSADAESSAVEIPAPSSAGGAEPPAVDIGLMVLKPIDG